MEVLLVPFLLLLSAICEGCLFPDYMYGTAFPWMIRSSAGPAWQKKGYQEVAFHGDHARIKHTKSREPEVIVVFSTFRCVEKIDDETMIVKVQEEGVESPGNFTCVQFVKRAPNVIQWSLGPRNAVKDLSLCDNRTLVLQAAPLVYYPHSSGFWAEDRNRDLQYKACPSIGGYIIRQWYNESSSPLCDFTKMIPMKLENECTTGEGIRLLEIGCHSPWNFPKEYFCLTSWEDDNYLYMLLWYTGINYFVPCLRFPRNRGKRFEAYFFLDGACDTGDVIEHSVSYARWYLVNHPSESMCTDDSPLCGTAAHNNCSQISHLCRQTCNTCPPEQQRNWNHEYFPSGVQGTWLKHTFALGKEVVEVSGNNLSIPSLGDFTNVGLSQCVNTEEYRRIALPSNAEEYSLLSFFKNGCSPHGTSVLMGNWSTSVASFRITISKPLITPFLTKWSPDESKYRIRESFESLCEHLTLYFYETDPEPIGTKYRVFPNGWFNLVRLDRPLEGVACRLPLNYAHFQLILASGTKCKVKVEVEDNDGTIKVMSSKTPYDATTFTLVLEECIPGYDIEEEEQEEEPEVISTEAPHVSGIESSRQEQEPPVVDEVRTHRTETHMCLTSFRDPYMNHYVITKVSADFPNDPLAHQDYICWLFSARSGRAYWLPISSCDSNTERQMSKANYQPYAVLNSAPGLLYFKELAFSMALIIVFLELRLL